MVDFSTINGGLALLQQEIDGDDVPALGNVGDLSSFSAGIATMQAAIIAGSLVATNPLIDFSSLTGTLGLFPVEGGGNEITFMGEVVTFDGEGPITFTVE